MSPGGIPRTVEARLHESVPALDEAIRKADRPVILAAHSPGCLAAAWSAVLYGKTGEHRVRGALLVAPPDVDEFDIEPRVRDLRPTPRLRLPFRPMLVASRDDPFASFARSRQMAASWGSEFVGVAGHLNAGSGLGEQSDGLRHLARLWGRNAKLLVAELGLWTVLA